MTLYSLPKILSIGVALLSVTATVVSCSSEEEKEAKAVSEFERDTAYAWLVSPQVETPIEQGPASSEVYTLPVNVVGDLNRVFADYNDTQLTAAQSVGMKPIIGLDSAYNPTQNVVKISTCDDFLVAPLTHSIPYLVPRAAQLLHEIGRAFRDSVKARGGKEYRIKVTSLMRTSNSVKRLKRVNRAATEQSCHLYGTTFDISWTNYDCRDSSYVVSLYSLKYILAEVLEQKRKEGRCYCIFENRPGCFHITTRK